MEQRLTRRAFLGGMLAGATGLGLALYGLEAWMTEAPWPEASGLAPTPTMAAPDPGLPVLLLLNPQAQPDFGSYLGEILRSEGLLGWQSTALAQLEPGLLAAFPLVILSPGPLDAAQADQLRTYVSGGGHLLAICPDPRLADLCGVRFLGATALGDYLRRTAAAPLDPQADPGPLQVHGRYERMALAGAEVLATSSGGDPLVTLHRFGQGQVALWAFDLARCVALLRQGNPQWAGQERDGMEGLRASDLFVGWIDLERIHVPQADEHQRLLLAVLENLGGSPLPRLWYFPDQAPALLVATGDAHGSRVSHIEQALTPVERHGGTMSIYYTPPQTDTQGRLIRKGRAAAAALPLFGSLLPSGDPLPSPAQVAAWRARGHEFGMHPYVEGGLEEGYNAYWNEFLKYGYGPLPPTVRTHRILWHGWVENARVQARYGLRMNLDHYHSSWAVRGADSTWYFGYLGGTGLPMRFVDEHGVLLSVYQQPTHLVDEHMLNVFDTGYDMGLNGEQAAAATISQIEASLQRFPAALGLQCHIDPFLFGGDKAVQVGRWLELSLAYAAAQGLPILSAERWLAFTEARAASRLHQLRWDSSTQQLLGELEIAASGQGANALLLPLRHHEAALRSVRLGTRDISWRELSLAGRSYAALLAPPGRYMLQAIYGA